MSDGVKKNSTEDQWEDLYKKGLGAPAYPNGDVIRWLFGTFPRSKAATTKILDLGCGSGRHCVLMAREGYQVSGSDYSPSALESAKARVTSEGHKILFKQAPGHLQPFEDQSFDGIISYGVLYYLTLDHIKATAREMHRLLKVGGQAFIMIKNNRDVRANKGTEISPYCYEINQTDPHMPWNNEQGMHLTLLPKDTVREIFQAFSAIKIEEITSTMGNGKFLESAWLIYLTK